MDLATIDHLLTTTRSVRKRLDFTRPVEPELVERCIEVATQAPTASNLQGWSFVVVTEAQKRQQLADVYRKAFTEYRQMQMDQAPTFGPDDLRVKLRPRIGESSVYLAEHMQDAPVLVIPCVAGQMKEVPHLAKLSKYESAFNAQTYGSILPAAWSLMLSLRARGLGAAWTTLHLMHEDQAAEILGIPDYVTQVALLPVAYFKGEDFKPAKRLPARELTHWNTWGQRR